MVKCTTRSYIKREDPKPANAHIELENYEHMDAKLASSSQNGTTQYMQSTNWNKAHKVTMHLSLSK